MTERYIYVYVRKGDLKSEDKGSGNGAKVCVLWELFQHMGVYQLHKAANTSLSQRGQHSAQRISKADGRRDCGKKGGYYNVSEALQRDSNHCAVDPCTIQST